MLYVVCCMLYVVCCMLYVVCWRADVLECWSAGVLTTVVSGYVCMYVFVCIVHGHGYGCECACGYLRTFVCCVLCVLRAAFCVLAAVSGYAGNGAMFTVWTRCKVSAVWYGLKVRYVQCAMCGMCWCCGVCNVCWCCGEEVRR